jgi:hypothetical protein
MKLNNHPEEAIHLLEYGLLSFFIFRALSYKIHDWTIYITAALIVTAIGIIDEFIQWIIPSRFWGYGDVGINSLAGVFFLLAIGKGIRPGAISHPVSAYSVELSVKTATVLLLIMGLCLSNTPDAVNRYTELFPGLSWLKNEEAMTEFGYLNKDSETDSFYSRLTANELRKIDSELGTSYGNTLSKNINRSMTYKELMNIYKISNKFLYEFLVHLSRRDRYIDVYNEASGKSSNLEPAFIAYKENQIIEKYFRNTLSASEFKLSDKVKVELTSLALSLERNYESRSGKLISFITLKAGLTYIIVALIIVWLTGTIWHRRLD